MQDYQQKYYSALEQSGELGESTHFIEFMLGVILKTIKKQQNVFVNVPTNVPLKRVQKLLVLLENNSQVTIAQQAKILKVTDKTIKRDLAKLKSNKQIVRVGSSKTGHWKILENN